MADDEGGAAASDGVLDPVHHPACRRPSCPGGGLRSPRLARTPPRLAPHMRGRGGRYASAPPASPWAARSARVRNV